MLRKMSALQNFNLRGVNGDLGKVTDFYFDQHQFILRYIIIDTGSWLKDEQTIISTEVIKNIDYQNKLINTDLEAEKIESAPSPDKNKPVSKAVEEKLSKYFNWPLYWISDHSTAGPTILAGSPMREKLYDFQNIIDEKSLNTEDEVESNLRSFKEVKNYHIKAENKEFGYLKDLFVDEDNWQIRYLLIDTRNFFPGKKILIAPSWIQNISWDKEKIYISQTKEELKNCPEYQEKRSEQLVERSYEEKLYDHYNKIKYWRR